MNETKNQIELVCPVKVDDELQVDIISVGSKGDGIAKVDGFILIIPLAKLGERAWVKVTAIRNTVGFAELI